MRLPVEPAASASGTPALDRGARPYYGWVILGAVSFTEVISWGILYYTFAVLVAPMQRTLGWSALTIQAGFSLALLCAGLAAVPVGRWLDRHGPRLLMTIGSMVASLLLLAWAEVTQVAAFYLIMAGIGVVSACVLYEPAFAIVATWFRQQRGRALAVLTFFGAWASLVFLPLSTWLVTQYDWRMALRLLAVLLAVLTIPPHALILRRHPRDLGLVPDGVTVADEPGQARSEEQSVPAGQAVREPAFWLMTLAVAASTAASVVMTVQLIPYLRAQGHTPALAASVAGLGGITSLLGRLLLAPLGERAPRPLLTAGLLGMQLVGVLLLLLAPTLVGALVYIVLFGAGAGTMTIMRAALLAERYGPAHYGSISGVQGLALTGARTLAPVGAGLLVGGSAGYVPLLLGLMLLLGVGLLAVLVVAHNERRRERHAILS